VGTGQDGRLRKPGQTGGTAIKSLYLLAHGFPRFFGVIIKDKDNIEKGLTDGVLWNGGGIIFGKYWSTVYLNHE
jgi:hypothetical protein